MSLIAQHTVRDYDDWKPAFDQHEAVRVKHGCLGHTIYRDSDNPSDLTIFTRWESREQAEEFAHDPSLAEAMQRGGVTGEPRITWAGRGRDDLVRGAPRGVALRGATALRRLGSAGGGGLTTGARLIPVAVAKIDPWPW